MLPKEISIAIRELVERMINDMGAKVTVGVWVGAEDVDANLSQVKVTEQSTYRYVPKLAGVSLTEGDQVLLLKGRGTPVVILGKVVGDVNSVNIIPD